VTQASETRLGMALLVFGLIVGLIALPNTTDILVSIVGLLAGLIVGVLTGGRSA